MDTIIIRVVRPLHQRGERIEPGTTLKLPLLAAAEALQSGRVELVHLADAALCLAAVRADVQRQLRASGAGRIAPPAVGPWMPIQH